MELSEIADDMDWTLRACRIQPRSLGFAVIVLGMAEPWVDMLSTRPTRNKCRAETHPAFTVY